MGISDGNPGTPHLVSLENPVQNNSMPPGGQANMYLEFVKEYYGRLSAAVALKNYAVDNNLQIDEASIQSLNAIYGKMKEFAQSGQDPSVTPPPTITADDITALDKAISSITRSTYPLTINNVNQVMHAHAEIPKELRLILMTGGVVGVAGAILCVLGLTYHWWPVFLTCSLLAICFGFLGSVVYGFFSALKITPSTNFTDYDRYDSYARLVLGILLGWVFYFTFVQSDFAAFTKPGSDSVSTKITILLPFLAGYSTSLVVNLLNKVIGAVQLTLGLEDRTPGGGNLSSGGQ